MLLDHPPTTTEEREFVADLREVYALAVRLRRVCRKVTDRPEELFAAVFDDDVNSSLGRDVREEVTALNVASGLWLLSSSWPFASPPLVD